MPKGTRIIGMPRKYLFIAYVKKEVYEVLANRGLTVALKTREL